MRIGTGLRKRFSERYATFKGRFASLVEGLWLRLYTLSRKHLPVGWRDEIWEAYLHERLDELRGILSDEVVLLLVEDLTPSIPFDSGREIRVVQREIRDETR